MCEVVDESAQDEVFYDVSATAEHLYDRVTKTFTDRGVPLKNVIGFASDGCNTMMGDDNSVKTRFERDCPGITVLKCICHSMALCASEASKKLPRSCEKLAKDVYRYFASSYNRQKKFKQCQKFLDLKIKKLLHPAQTRWLSLKEVVERLLEMWEALILYFATVPLDETETVKDIITGLNDPLIRLLLFFVNFALPKFTQANLTFQSSSPQITSMQATMEKTLKSLLKCYLDGNYVERTPLHSINPRDMRYVKPRNLITVGENALLFMQKPAVGQNNALMDHFYQYVTDYLIVGCEQIQKR